MNSPSDGTFTIEEKDGVFYARGDTYEAKEDLKALGFGWNRTEMCWLTARLDAAIAATKLPGFRRSDHVDP